MEHDEKDVLSLENVCSGAMPEIFKRELTAVLANIADLNTSSDKKRNLTLKLTFTPFPDRSGAQIELTCETKLAGVKGVKSNAFIYSDKGQLIAIPQDARQEKLFGKPTEQANVLPMAAGKESK
jgi:hypothetical protein